MKSNADIEAVRIAAAQHVAVVEALFIEGLYRKALQKITT